MANGNKQDVTLVIRAQNEAKAEFQKLVDLVSKVEKGFDGAEHSAEDLSKAIASLTSGKAGSFFLETERAVSRANQEYRESQQQIKLLAARLREMKSIVGPLEPTKAKEFNAELKKTESEFAKTEKHLKTQSAEYRTHLSLLREIRSVAGSNNAAALNSRIAGLNVPASAGRAPSPGLPGGLAPKFDPSGPRQTLDFYQRLRGQVLAMTSAYIGLYGAVNQFNKALDEQQQIQSIRARLGVSIGTSNPGAIDAEMARLKETAKSLGLEFLPLISSFSKFSVSAKLSGATAQQVNTVFQNMSKAGAVLGLTTDEMRGTFVGLEQIFNKSKLTAEDFRGQVAERLPGAMAVLAKSLGVTTSALGDMFQKGQIGSDALVGFAVQYGKYLETIDIPLTQRLAGQLNNLSNAATELRSDFAEGVAPGLIEAVGILREQMEDPEFRAGMKDFGRAIGEIAIAAAKLAPYIPDLVKFIGILVGLRALRGGVSILLETVVAWQRFSGVLTGTVAAVTAQEAAIVKLSTTVTRLGPAISVASRFIGILGFAGAFATLAFEIKKANDALDETQKKAGILSQLSNIAKRVIGIGGESPAEQERREADARRVRDQQRAKEQLAEQEKHDAQLLASVTLVEQTTEAYKSQLDVIRLQGDELGTINQKLQENKKEITDAADAARRAIRTQASVAGGGSGVLTGRQQDELLLIESDLQAALTKLESEAEEERRKIREKANEEREASAKRAADLIKAAEGLALKDKDASEFDRAQVIHNEFVAMQERVTASKDINELEKERLKLLLQQAEVERVAILNRETLLEEARKKEEEASKLTQIRDIRIQTITSQAEASGLPEAAVIEQVRKEYEDTETSILSALESAKAFYETVGGEEAALKIAQIEAQIEKVKTASQDLGDSVKSNVAAIQEQMAGGLTDAFLDFADGTKTAREALSDFASDFLRFIAEAILKKQILNAIQSASGTGGFFGALAGLMHDGGRVGSATRSRSINPASIMSAPRMHDGGVAGLKSNEITTVLERGETVRTTSQEQALQRQMSVAQAATPQLNVTMINAVDSEAMYREGASAPANQKVLLNQVRANKHAFRRELGIS